MLIQVEVIVPSTC